MDSAVEGTEGTPPAGEEAGIEQRPRSDAIRGIQVQSLGLTWLLPSLGMARGFEEERNEYYDKWVLTNKVSMDATRRMAFCMVRINYEHDAEEIARIVRGMDEDQMVEAVFKNLLAVEIATERGYYSDWARTALVANGIDPTTVRGEDLAGVLHHLVGAKRAVAHDEFTSSGRFANYRRENAGG